MYLLSKSDKDGIVNSSIRAIAKDIGIPFKTVYNVIKKMANRNTIGTLMEHQKTTIEVVNHNSYKVKFRAKEHQWNTNGTQNVKSFVDLLTSNITKKEALTSIKKKENYLANFKDCAQDYTKFVDWLMRNAPYCFVHMDVPTQNEFDKLKKKYTGKELADVIAQIENRTDLRTRYKSLYLTTLNWAKRNIRE